MYRCFAECIVFSDVLPECIVFTDVLPEYFAALSQGGIGVHLTTYGLRLLHLHISLSFLWTLWKPYTSYQSFWQMVTHRMAFPAECPGYLGQYVENFTSV